MRSWPRSVFGIFLFFILGQRALLQKVESNGASGILPDVTHSGYLVVNKDDGSRIFYSYYEAQAQQNEAGAPILLWLQVSRYRTFDVRADRPFVSCCTPFKHTRRDVTAQCCFCMDLYFIRTPMQCPAPFARLCRAGLRLTLQSLCFNLERCCEALTQHKQAQEKTALLEGTMKTMKSLYF